MDEVTSTIRVVYYWTVRTLDNQGIFTAPSPSNNFSKLWNIFWLIMKTPRCGVYMEMNEWETDKSVSWMGWTWRLRETFYSISQLTHPTPSSSLRSWGRSSIRQTGKKAIVYHSCEHYILHLEDKLFLLEIVKRCIEVIEFVFFLLAFLAKWYHPRL